MGETSVTEAHHQDQVLALLMILEVATSEVVIMVVVVLHQEAMTAIMAHPGEGVLPSTMGHLVEAQHRLLEEVVAAAEEDAVSEDVVTKDPRAYRCLSGMYPQRLQLKNC